MSDYENIQQTNNGQAPVREFANYDFSQITRNGGVMETRVSSGNDQGQIVEPSRRSSNIQAGLGGVTTVNSNGQVISTPAVSTFHATELVGNNAGSFLSTARNGFFPAQGNLNPDTVVTYQGMEVTLSGLESIGVVRRTATGYEPSDSVAAAVPGGGQQQNQQQQTAPGLPEGTQYFPDEVESSFAAAIEPFPQALYDQAMAKALVGGVESINFNELAYQSNMTPAEARNRAEFAVRSFTMQADSIATGMGAASANDVWIWCEANRSAQVADAQHQMVFARNTRPLRALVSDYLRNVPTDDASLREVGIKTRKSASGETLIQVGNTWTTPAAAARSGIL